MPRIRSRGLSSGNTGSRLTGWLLAILLTLPGLFATSTASAQDIVTLNRARATLQPDGGPATQQEVKLPHRWDHAFPGRNGVVSYRLQLPERTPNVPYALYLPRAGNQLQVLLDGREIFHHGELRQPRSDAAKAPLWIPLPATSQTQAGELVITASVQGGRWGGLTEVHVGPSEPVRSRYLEHYRWRQWGALGVVFAMAVVAVLAAGLWYLQRESVYASFAIASATGMLRFFDRVIEEPPLSWPLWGGLMAAALSLHVLWTVRFSLQLVGLATPRWLRVLWMLMALEVTVAMASFLLYRPAWWTVALAVVSVPAWVATAQVLWCAWRQRSREAMGLAAAGGIAVVAGLYDLLRVRIAGDGASNFSVLPHASMAFVLLMGWVVLDRFARQGRQLRALTDSLDHQVRDKERELQASYEALRRESEQRAAMGERQRIMRDIHDGVGAQLVGLVNLLRKDHVPADMLREHADAALDELRMAVDALQNVEGDLATMLASMRYRLQDRFRACGITLEWALDASGTTDAGAHTPEQLVQVQRIVLEAFTNILKHAHATRIWVHLHQQSSDRTTIVIEDNGQGFIASPGERSAGHGLRNMRLRAQAVGARLDITASAHGGVRVALDLPLPQRPPVRP